jgi:hypothetical protein
MIYATETIAGPFASGSSIVEDKADAEHNPLRKSQIEKVFS